MHLSGILSKAIRANIITKAVKYKNFQEKIGEVIDIDKTAKSCTVSLITRDGIGQVVYDVKVQSTEASLGSDWFPEQGDYVKLTENFKRYVIVGKFDIGQASAATENSTYDDIYADITGSGGGYVGY